MKSSTKTPTMNRRDFMKYASLISASAAVPLLTPELLFAANGKRPEKIVVLVELKGGNDGFNTLIPFADELYYRYRPSIGIQARHHVKGFVGFF